MTDTATHVVEHQIEINVPADDVYRLIADVLTLIHKARQDEPAL